jgi:hypothetical protein
MLNFTRLFLTTKSTNISSLAERIESNNKALESINLELKNYGSVSYNGISNGTF